MNKFTFYVRTFVVLFLCLLWSNQAYSQSGSWLDQGNYDISWFDESKSTFYISTAKQLAGVAYLSNSQNYTFSDKSIILQNDIDLSKHYWKAIKAFSGVLDGKGHTINYVMAKIDTDQRHAVFLENLMRGKIQNLTIGENCNIKFEGTDTYGCHVSFCLEMCDHSVIDNCVNKANIYVVRATAAPFCNEMYETCTISNCDNYGDIYAEIGSASGIVWDVFCKYSYVEPGTILNCNNYGTISSSYIAAGIVTVCDGKIKKCSNHGVLKYIGDEEDGGWCYGITRHIEGEISDCKNTASFSSKGYAAGISGDVSGIMTRCDNSGNIKSDYSAGGIVEVQSHQATISDCYNTGNIEGGTYAGGIVGQVSTRFSCPVIVSCVNKGKITTAAGQAGGIVGLGDNYTYIDKCVNLGEVQGAVSVKDIIYQYYTVSTIASGIANGSNIINCLNRGKVTAHSVATSDLCTIEAQAYASGIGGSYVYNSCNEGDVKSITKSEVYSYDNFQCSRSAIFVGGISCQNYGMIYNCYNRGDIDYSARQENAWDEFYKVWEHHIGGIAGSSSKEKIEHSFYSNRSASCYHSWWHNPLASNPKDIDTSVDGGTKGFLEKDDAKTPGFVATLNSRKDTIEFENVKFALLKWKQGEDSFPILDGLPSTTPTGIENIAADNPKIDFSVEGNNICFAEDNKEQKTVIIYNLQGQMIDRIVTHDNKIGINVPRQVVVMKIICGSNVLTKKLLMK